MESRENLSIVNTEHKYPNEEELIELIESKFSGENYHKNLLNVLKEKSSIYRGELLKTACMLLDKDLMLAVAFFKNLTQASASTEPEGIRKWAGIGIKIFELDKELAIDYFCHSAALLKDMDINELEKWALQGIAIYEEDSFLGRSYFSLKSKQSKEFIESIKGSMALNEIIKVLRYYALGLSGVNFNILPRRMLQVEQEPTTMNPVIDGRNIYLAPVIKKYGDFENNLSIYKLSIIHEVGHVQFSSHKIKLEDAAGLLEDIRNRYSFIKKKTHLTGLQPEGIIDITDIVALFPNKAIAGTILGILEDARVEYRIMEYYRGISSELERIRYQMLLTRSAPQNELEQFMESLLWLSAGHEPVYNISKGIKDLLSEIRNLLEDKILQVGSSILDSLDTTFRIYIMLDEYMGPLSQKDYEALKNIDYRGVDIRTFIKKDLFSPPSHENIIRNFIPENEVEPFVEKDESKEEVKHQPKYAMKKNWKIRGSYRYDEWDVVLNDYKVNWCTINEIEPFGISNYYYNDASEKYRHEIFLIKYLFNRMKPQAFRRMKGQRDGTEIDIDAFIDALIQKKCGINPEDKLYLRWDKHERDVATLFLIDISYSTHKTVGYEGKSILDVEKDSLILMIQALESIGDKYAIYAFSGQTRDDVEYFIIKEFEEELSDDVAHRISLLEPVSNTRLGPAIRHSIMKLEKVDTKNKIIILLSDGEPFDNSPGEIAYKERIAEEDIRTAIKEGNAKGIHFFCITVDPDPGKYLDNIFSEAGYIIIDDASSLPERLPLLYKRLTT
ncbi:MAG: VWA domain-containing protein [Methanomethylovorans sp.]|jgi:hypothetical protein|nr:VWA domain-containing protein [Methanomethylovorans sp.]